MSFRLKDLKNSNKFPLSCEKALLEKEIFNLVLENYKKTDIVLIRIDEAEATFKTAVRISRDAVTELGISLTQRWSNFVKREIDYFSSQYPKIAEVKKEVEKNLNKVEQFLKNKCQNLELPNPPTDPQAL